MKIEDGIIDPPRRIHLHNSSSCLFRRVTRGGPIHELGGILTTWQSQASGQLGSKSLHCLQFLDLGNLMWIPHTGTGAEQ